MNEERKITFDSLPEKIKEWLSSTQATYLIMEINRKLGFRDAKISVIPKMIVRLVTKKIEPINFINELSHELNIGFESARSITQDIEINIFRPIELDLRGDLDIDIKLFYFGKPGPQNQKESQTQELPDLESPAEVAPAPVAEFRNNPIPPQGPVVDLQSFRIKSDRPLSPLTFASGISSKSAPEPKKEAPQTEKGLPEETHPTPFMLHQENPTSAPSINPQGQISQTSKSSLTMKVQNFYQSQASTSPSAEKTIPKPISIKFETSTADSADQKISKPIPVSKQDAPPALKSEIPDLLPVAADSNARVVHYSNLRTPLTTVGTPKNSIEKDNVLDLRKIIK